MGSSLAGATPAPTQEQASPSPAPNQPQGSPTISRGTFGVIFIFTKSINNYISISSARKNKELPSSWAAPWQGLPQPLWINIRIKIYKRERGCRGKERENRLSTYAPDLQHYRAACNISYHYFRNVDSNRRYVGSSAGRMLIVTQR